MRWIYDVVMVKAAFEGVLGQGPVIQTSESIVGVHQRLELLTFEFIKVFRETCEIQNFILILEIMWFWFQKLSDSALNSWVS